MKWKVASKIVVDIFINEFENLKNLQESIIFVSTLKLANKKCLMQQKGRMGTTLISVVIKDKKLHYLSVGDSAIILLEIIS